MKRAIILAAAFALPGGIPVLLALHGIRVVRRRLHRRKVDRELKSYGVSAPREVVRA